MKKRLITTKILLLLLGSGIACYGKAINENTAKTIGSNYLISNNIPGVSSTGGLTTAFVATAQVNGATVVDYYVFNHCCPTKNQRGSRSRPFFVVWSYHTTNTKDEPKYKFCRTAPIRSDNYIM